MDKVTEMKERKKVKRNGQRIGYNFFWFFEILYESKSSYSFLLLLGKVEVIQARMRARSFFDLINQYDLRIKKIAKQIVEQEKVETR